MRPHRRTDNYLQNYCLYEKSCNITLSELDAIFLEIYMGAFGYWLSSNNNVKLPIIKLKVNRNSADIDSEGMSAQH